MKKSLLFYIIGLLVLNNAYSQFVSIPDSNFRKELKALYPTCFNTSDQLNTTCSAITSALSLNVCSKNIKDLTGLQYFTNLTNLCAKSNKLTTLPALPSKLVSLVCSDNLITSLPTLPTTLTTLSCKTNKLTSLPTLPASMIYLDCSFNNITALPTLTANLNTVIADNNCFTVTPTKPSSTLLTTFKVTPNLSNCPVGILDNLFTDNQDLAIFPNPAKDKITVTAEGSDKVKIYNSDGILIHSENIVQTQDINIQHLKSGVYFVKIGQKSSKLIKE